MFIKLKNLSSFVLILSLFACASTKPETIPTFEKDSLSPLKLQDLKPRSMGLKVINIRASNIAAKNSAQVEQAVFDLMQDSLVRGGFKISKNSPNQMHVSLQDCEKAAEGAACVKAVTKLETREYRLSFEAYSSNGYSRGNSAYQSFGDMTQAYLQTLQMTVEGFEKKSKE